MVVSFFLKIPSWTIWGLTWAIWEPIGVILGLTSTIWGPTGVIWGHIWATLNTE